MGIVTWEPSTCACVCDFTNKKILKPCRTHRTFNQVIAHNRSFNLRGDSEDSILRDKITERKKPEFQRR